MKKLFLFSFLFFCTIPNSLSQFWLVDEVDKLGDFKLGEDISFYNSEIISPQKEGAYTEYMYNGSENQYIINGIKFRLIVLVFDEKNKLAKIKGKRPVKHVLH